MKFVVLDLEWDSTFFVPQKRFVNQILQIGAVKLDQNFVVEDTFEETVKSSISNRVSGRFTQLTGITNDDMRNGISLEDAVNRYNRWIGEDAVTMTWSNSDLYTVIENEKFLLNGIRFKIEKYLDLQSFIQNEMRGMGFEINSQISLSAAAEALGIETEGFDMHTAKDDSLICGELLKRYYNKERFDILIKDTSKNQFFKRLAYKPTYISDIKSSEIDSNELEFFCEKCGSKAVRKGKWRYRNRWFFGEFHCENCHNKFSARISFRRDFDGISVKKKIYVSKKTKDKTLGGKDSNDMQSVPEKMQ